ncbi:MAG: phosphotransferase [Bacteroidales bacterium]|nr:phosphotransferase [Lachnoclostridium sp.]MCM1383564.1 phosphotransferase [Lachnoclostridium sp.]MCM1464153.1 phosphotransferase [Bacteroidales bacterium]
METTLSVNGKIFSVVKMLGKGNGGYSYLVKDGIGKYVLKQIHQELCDNAPFDSRIEEEIRDYMKLKSIGIKMPAMLDIDTKEERILKEYIEGQTIYELMLRDKIEPSYLKQIQQMCALLHEAAPYMECFPTQFVVRDKEIYYVDFECNDYLE